MQILDLSGQWDCRTDEEGTGISRPFFLPGSACGNKIGKKQEYYENFSREALRAPRERYSYVGPLWLQREVTVPGSWEGKSLRLFLERVNLASELWVDEEKIGRQIIDLSAPHCHDLTHKLTAGTHILTLRIDNRNLLNIDAMASGYSQDTQGYWNGIVGRIELQCEELFHLENIQIYPRETGILVKLTQTDDIASPLEKRHASVELSVTGPKGERYPVRHYDTTLYNSRQVSRFSYELTETGDACAPGRIRYWDEFHPDLYTLTVRYRCGDYSDEKTVTFGMRTVAVRDKEICLNGRPVSLRGTTNCAIHPLTGYPPMDIESWQRYFRLIKAYGLNHVRFHTWCPPENAFRAADQLGVYLSVEMPLWLNRDVCALEFGDDPVHRTYFHRQAETISRAYGNHPSFLMFSNGNENMGDFELLEDITTRIKACDGRRLYTLTSNFDHPVQPCEDYLSAFEAGGHKVRIQDLHDLVERDTCLDYRDAVRDVPVPVISFETGQYCTYPDVTVTDKYTGNMLPVNYHAIRREMERRGILHRLPGYVEASGRLAARLYKEDIEAVLRTPKMAGFQLLSLTDYTGQNTAPVGILDEFLDSKGFISEREFRCFCSPVVPLFKAKRIFSSGETLHAELDLYDYGERRIQKPVFCLELYDRDSLFARAVTEERHAALSLASVRRPCMLRVRLSVGEHSNHWNIFVFPPDPSPLPEVRTVSRKDEIRRLIETGGKAVITGECLKNPAPGGFVPVFWSPAFFPTRRPCGAVIREDHPVFQSFPTEKYPDYQWKWLLDHCSCAELSGFPQDFRPIVEFVPNFADNRPSSPLFEAKVGNAEVLFCGFSFEDERLPVGQLRRSILTYVSSPAFRPRAALSPDTLLGLFT